MIVSNIDDLHKLFCALEKTDSADLASQTSVGIPAV